MIDFDNDDNCECSESYRHRGEHTPGCPADDGERAPITEKALNGYIVFIEGTKHEVYAASTYEAQTAAKALYKGRKKYPSISVHLVELAGEQVTSVITS